MSDQQIAQVTDRDEWNSLLDRLRLDDPYLRHAYVHASALLDDGDPVLLHVAGAAGDVVLVLVERAVPGGGELRDLITPYGYGGPLGAGDTPPWDAFFEAFEQWCRSRSIVSGFYRLHPRYRDQLRLPAAAIEVELAGTVAWRVDLGRDLHEAMHSRNRRLVRKAERAGVDVEVVLAPSSLTEFVSLYEQTMHRQQADEFYFFGDEYWLRLLGLGERLVVIEGRLDGELIAALVCMHGGDWLHYHLGASADAARSIGASNLLFFRAAQWAQQQGCARFHLGGGVGGGVDSLLEFKQRFDPEAELAHFAIAKQVLDAKRYRELSGGDSVDGFFPAYRQPVSAPR